MKKITLLLFAFVAFIACENPEKVIVEKQNFEKPNIDNLNNQIDAWHIAAAQADASAYFGMMAPESIFIGTDKTENWTKAEFEALYRPYFAEGKSWDFIPIDRNWYFNKTDNMAWFDETLETWMGVCQSSGVMEKQSNGEWLIKHYQLSLTVDNDQIDAVIEVTK
jgi:ketosteroid isomerase-like protein